MPLQVQAITYDSVYVVEADETGAASHPAFRASTPCSESKQTDFPIANPHGATHLAAQSQQCPAPPHPKHTLFMAAIALLAVTVVCGAICMFIAITAVPVAYAVTKGPLLLLSPLKAVGHGSAFAQRLVSLKLMWHHWWSRFAASARTTRSIAGTIACCYAANTRIAAKAFGHQLSAATSSMTAVTGAGVTKYKKGCSAAKLYCRAFTLCCRQCLRTSVATMVWLHLQAQLVYCCYTQNITAAARATWKWVSASASHAARAFATTGMTASRSTWSRVKVF